MKESELYLNFFRRNWLYLVAPLAIAIFISTYFYSSETTRIKLSQSYRMEYGLENIETSINMADQAVAELRLSDFDDSFPGTKAVIYKSAPLIVSIEIISEDKNKGFELLLKETEYLKKNFTVSTLNQIQSEQVEPDIFKYLLTGLIFGVFAGLFVSLVREYFRNY